MVARRALALVSVGLVLTVGLTACSDQYAGRMEVSGVVKLQGQPLNDGSIRFIPLDKQASESGATITNGQYKIPRSAGLKPGKYLVQITAGDGKTPVNEEEAAGPGGSTNIVSVDMIPEEWNVNSKKEVVVEANKTNKFDFEIPNMNPKAKKR